MLIIIFHIIVFRKRLSINKIMKWNFEHNVIISSKYFINCFYFIIKTIINAHSLSIAIIILINRK